MTTRWLRIVRDNMSNNDSATSSKNKEIAQQILNSITQIKQYSQQKTYTPTGGLLFNKHQYPSHSFNAINGPKDAKPSFTGPSLGTELIKKLDNYLDLTIAQKDENYATTPKDEQRYQALTTIVGEQEASNFLQLYSNILPKDSIKASPKTTHDLKR